MSQFEVFKGRGGDRRRPASATPQVRFARGGLIVFNPAATEALPTALVELLHAPDAIGFRATADPTNGYRLQRVGNQSQVTATAFSRFVGHRRHESTIYPAEIIDGIVVVKRTPE